MKLGEMSREQQRTCWRQAANKVKAQFEQPHMQAAFTKTEAAQ